MAGKQSRPEWMVDPPPPLDAAAGAAGATGAMPGAGAPSGVPPLPESADASDAVPPDDTSGGEYFQAFLSEPTPEETALKELRSILMGKERGAINRLEGAVTGFISSVIRDDHLDQLVTRIIHDAVDRHMMTLRDDMRATARTVVDEAIEREIATRRGTLQDQINPFVEDAVAERMAVARRNINAALDRTYDDVIGRLSEVGRKKVVNELAPLLVRESKDRIRENRDQIQAAIDEIVEDMVWDGMHAAVVRHMDKVMQEEQFRARVNRTPMWIAVGIAGLMTLVAVLLWSGQGGLRDELSELKRQQQSLESELESLRQRDAAPEGSLPTLRPVTPRAAPRAAPELD